MIRKKFKDRPIVSVRRSVIGVYTSWRPFKIAHLSFAESADAFASFRRSSGRCSGVDLPFFLNSSVKTTDLIILRNRRDDPIWFFALRKCSAKARIKEIKLKLCEIVQTLFPQKYLIFDFPLGRNSCRQIFRWMHR